MNPELLAPAGNPEKLRTAIRYGADAVYAGLEGYSLRSRAGNFTLDDLETARKDTRKAGAKLYVAVNLIPRDSDLATLRGQLDSLSHIGVDALIISDPGVLQICVDVCPQIPLHLSTQANVINSGSAAFWFNSGVTRIVLARELSIDQIRAVCEQSNGELEVFVHGAMCISYSGRCYLSRYMADRDANRGDCAQSCRWSYRVLEESRRPGSLYPVEEDEQGTYVFNSRDLCALPLLSKLVRTGVHALKIEGRMKSVHYVATVVDVYRHALNLLMEDGDGALDRILPDLLTELNRVSNRQFTTAFLSGRPDDHVRLDSTAYENQYAMVGVVSDVNDMHTEVHLKNPLEPGDTIVFLKPGLKRISITVNELLDGNGQPIGKGQSGDIVRIPQVPEVREGYIVRR